MTEVVYLLGAGFNCSILDPDARRKAPLANNFFKVLLSAYKQHSLPFLNIGVFPDLMSELKRYWKLDLDTLSEETLDIEECLTFIESQQFDGPPPDRFRTLDNAGTALRYLLFMYLGELSLDRRLVPAADRFGSDVLSDGADVITFNYDTFAEVAIESASHLAVPYKELPHFLGESGYEADVPYEYLDASHYRWNRNLAYGIKFEEVSMPVPGLPKYVTGDLYYSCPANNLKTSTRVLKLHGSIDWLHYTEHRWLSPDIDTAHEPSPPKGVILSRSTSYWGDMPTLLGWRMRPVIIAPNLYKDYRSEPWPTLWQSALDSLLDCNKLIVIGYSFPPTDFRTRRLLREAFSEHAPRELIVVNPDETVTKTVRNLTHYEGPDNTYKDLQSFYGVLPS
jgi:hypothetical protein